MSIAKTIIEQIKTIDPRAMMAWGATYVTDMGDGLMFKTTGLCRWKGNVHIHLNRGTDLYDITYFKVYKGQMKIKKESTGVFVEDLVNDIDLVVG